MRGRTSGSKYKLHVRAVSWLFYEKILRVLSGIFVVAAVAKYLGPEHYGELAIAFGVISVFVAGAAMGSDHINISELSRRGDRRSSLYLNSALIARLFWAIFCLLACSTFVYFSVDENYEIYFIAAILIPFSSIAIIGNKIQADGDFNLFAKITTIILIFSAFIKIIGIYLLLSTRYFAVTMVLENFLIGISFLYLYISKKNFVSNFSIQVAINYFKLCLPTAMSAILVALYLRLELFMVHFLMGDKAVGLWSAALMFITPWTLVAGSVIPVANRALSKLGNNHASYKGDLTRLIRLMLAISLLAIITNCLIAQIAIPELFGEQYREIKSVICIASFSIIPLFMGSVQEIWIAHQRSTSIVLSKIIIGLPISAINLYFFGSHLGLDGIAVSLVASYLITAIFMNYFFDRKFFKIQLLAIGISDGKRN